MSKRTVYDCDKCGAVDIQKYSVSFSVGERMVHHTFPDGSTESGVSYEKDIINVDLCSDCLYSLVKYLLPSDYPSDWEKNERIYGGWFKKI